MNYIEALQNRYSVKKFDKTQGIAPEKMNAIIEAARLSASSFGLQPYRLLVIQSEELLQRLVPAFHNPSQVATCSTLIAIVTKKDIEDSYIDAYFQQIMQTREIDMEPLEFYKQYMLGYREQMRASGISHWNEKQSYILLGHLLFAAALEGVDACPMEGFSKETLNEILGIDTEKEEISVTIAFGVRAEDDFFQTMKKVRKPNEKFLEYL